MWHWLHVYEGGQGRTEENRLKCWEQNFKSSHIPQPSLCRGGNREPIPTHNQFQLTNSIRIVCLQLYWFFLTILSFPCLHEVFRFSWNFALQYICVTLCENSDLQPRGSIMERRKRSKAWLHLTKQDEKSVQCCNNLYGCKYQQHAKTSVYPSWNQVPRMSWVRPPTLHYTLSRCSSVCLSWICSCSQSCADIILEKIKLLLVQKTVLSFFATQLTTQESIWELIRNWIDRQNQQWHWYW